jgi:hypothetical protein
MAEAFGVFSGCVGIISLVLQITSKIEDLREFITAEVSDKLGVLSNRLELFRA